MCSATPGSPTLEQCGNALDDDCDGAVDDGCGDTDGDGLIDVLESAVGSSATDQDSDDDGVIDGDEPTPYVDTDGDGLIDVRDPAEFAKGSFKGAMNFPIKTLERRIGELTPRLQPRPNAFGARAEFEPFDFGPQPLNPR